MARVTPPTSDVVAPAVMGIERIEIRAGQALAFHSPIIHNLFILQRRSQPNGRDMHVLGRSRDFNEPRVGGGGSVEAFGGGGGKDSNDGLGRSGVEGECVGDENGEGGSVDEWDGSERGELGCLQ